jgi:hypothetical protein
MFMERGLCLCANRGLLAMINMQSWMFLGTYQKLRGYLWNEAAILNMAHIGERGFDTIGGAVVSTTAFYSGANPQKAHRRQFRSTYRWQVRS